MILQAAKTEFQNNSSAELAGAIFSFMVKLPS